MRAFNRLFAVVLVIVITVFAAAEIPLLRPADDSGDREYMVEITRLVRQMEENGADSADVSNCRFVTGITSEKSANGDLFGGSGEYCIREINGILYRFDYTEENHGNGGIKAVVTIALGAMALLVVGVMIYIRQRMLRPFDELKNVPYELSKGNLTVPIKEEKSRFFGKFVWGIDLLRESMEEQKKRELELHRDRKTLLLSLSHDIKTPLSAIKLYSKALSKGLYKEKEKQMEAAEGINAKADEIERYVTQIIEASREDFLSLDVKAGEFYLSELTASIRRFYAEKLELNRTAFKVEERRDCLLKGDLDRAVEVIQNLMENAVKYGDGKEISIGFSQEEGCLLMTVFSSGGDMSDVELPHIFESFWRGSNAGSRDGSGLGLYICRQLMNKMGGDIYAELRDGGMAVTAVFVRA